MSRLVAAVSLEEDVKTSGELNGFLDVVSHAVNHGVCEVMQVHHHQEPV